jgi:phage virion morphogenesis protein
MSGVTLTVRHQAVRAALAQLVGAVQDPAPALRSLGVLLVRNTRTRIVAEGPAPDGTAWPRLAAATRKRKRGPGMLRERAMRGGLMASLTSQVDGRRLRVGTNKIYAATHQFGRDAIPARPFLGISEEDQRDIVEVLADHMRRALARR